MLDYDYMNELIKQNGKYQFEPIEIMPGTGLKEVIKRLRENYQAGIRAVVVCTEKPDEVISEEELQRQLNDGDTDAVSLTQRDDILAGALGCARLGPFDYLGQAMQAALDCTEQAVGGEYIDKDAKLAISAYCNLENLKMPLCDTWTKELAKKASQMLRAEEMARDKDWVPNICILLILPQKIFDTFLQEDCYFPLFIKYAVRIMDGGQVIKLLEMKLQEKDKQIGEKDKQIEEKDKQLEEMKKSNEAKDRIITTQAVQLDWIKEELGSIVFVMDKKIDPHAPRTDGPAVSGRPETRTQQGAGKGQVEIATQEAQEKTMQGLTGDKAKMSGAEDRESEVIDDMDIANWDRDDRDKNGGRRR